MKIRTVKGITDAGNFNFVDAHTHIWIKKEESQNKNFISEESDFPLIKSCIEDFKECNGSLLVDCTPYGCGRDVNKLRELSIETRVEVVAVTGFHLRDYYPPDFRIWEFNQMEAVSFFTQEITTGFKETLNKDVKIKAGLIKIPFIGSLENTYKTLTDAAIQAAYDTCIPILVHTEMGLNIEWFADYIEDKGIKPEKVAFCHVDKRNELIFQEKLAFRGFYLEYDTFLREKYKPEKNTWNLMSSMIKSGFEKSLMIGSDIFGNSMWGRVRAEIGYGGFFKKLAQSMVEKYEDSGVVMNILGGNAVRFLSLKK
ncbi:MAG: phosphotriesterase family protein [Candidatus Humimicrobiaceae bacterium]